MKIQDVMTREVKTCSSTDSLNRAAQLMWEGDCGTVPVVDAESCVIGMITDRDVCMGAWTKGRSLSSVRVGEVMSKDVKSCQAGDEVADVRAIMSTHRVRRVPVTDPLGRIVGIVSLNDLARRAATPGTASNGAAAAVAETLASVCRPWRELDGQVVSAQTSASMYSARLVPQLTR